jgi:hypothetical protein
MKLLNRFFGWMKQTFPRTAWFIRNLRPSNRAEARKLKNKSTEEIFTSIYDNNNWLSDESRSGLGSTMEATRHLRERLPKVMAALGARSLLDAPCGDFNWMRHCELNIDRYVGGDIVAKLVADLNARYASPTRSFIQLDIISQPLPECDVLFCRDLFLHLSFDHIHAALENFRRSQCKWLITSTYADVRVNLDTFTGGVRILNLCLPPFNFPTPIEYIVDRGETAFDRRLGVWTKQQVLDAVRA